MFYDRYYDLCKKNGEKPYSVAKKIGLGNSNVAQWKKGSTPRSDVLQKIADYFEISVGYLLGYEDKEKTTPALEDGQKLNTIKIAGRDGTFLERELTDEQLTALKLLMDQLPDADNL